MANTIAQEQALIDKLNNVDFIDVAAQVAIINEIGKLTFSQNVFDTLTQIAESYWGDSYIPNQDAPARAALAILESKMGLSMVRDWFSREATHRFNASAIVREIYGAHITSRPTWLNVACANVMWKRSLSAMIAACE